MFMVCGFSEHLCTSNERLYTGNVGSLAVLLAYSILSVAVLCIGWIFKCIGHSKFIDSIFLLFYSIKLFKDESRIIAALSGGLRKAALERKYGGVSDDPEPLVNYLDVSTLLCLICLLCMQPCV